MMNQSHTEGVVQEIMLDFARLTGLAPDDAHPRRYLWTDAFAVCNYLELFARTNDRAYLDLGLRLVDQVHRTLGRHREDDPRRGWISGLNDHEGERHPTQGGLRIGKRLTERRAGESFDERLEWDQDGQYYHYLTKWMHALNCTAQVSGVPGYLAWAMELAKTAHARFTHDAGRKRMYWKMSIDLSRPLVPSMGQHDPLDGFVTYSELAAAAARDFPEQSLPDLEPEIMDIAAICRGIHMATDDPLGIGGLLFDASRIAQLMMKGSPRNPDLLQKVVDSARLGMKAFVAGGSLRYPARYRLAFRELGLAVGLSAVEGLSFCVRENPGLFGSKGRLDRGIEELMDYLPLGETIRQFWMESKNLESSAWAEHGDINMVMLATSLVPDRFLKI